jgi:hypothetical protein
LKLYSCVGSAGAGDGRGISNTRICAGPGEWEKLTTEDVLLVDAEGDE